jgi:hypothetical protein
MKSSLLLSLWFAIALGESLRSSETYRKLMAEYRGPVYSTSLKSTQEFYAGQNIPKEEIYKEAKILADEQLVFVGNIIHRCLDEAEKNKDGLYPPANSAETKAKKLADRINYFLNQQTGSHLHRRFFGALKTIGSKALSVGKGVTGSSRSVRSLPQNFKIRGVPSHITTGSSRSVTSAITKGSAFSGNSVRPNLARTQSFGNTGVRGGARPQLRRANSLPASFTYSPPKKTLWHKFKSQFRKGQLIDQIKIYMHPKFMKVIVGVTVGTGAILILKDYFFGSSAESEVAGSWEDSYNELYGGDQMTDEYLYDSSDYNYDQYFDGNQQAQYYDGASDYYYDQYYGGSQQVGASQSSSRN